MEHYTYPSSLARVIFERKLLEIFGLAQFLNFDIESWFVFTCLPDWIL